MQKWRSERALVVLRRCVILWSLLFHVVLALYHPFLLNPRMPCSFLVAPHCTSSEYWTKNDRKNRKKLSFCRYNEPLHLPKPVFSHVFPSFLLMAFVCSCFRCRRAGGMKVQRPHTGQRCWHCRACLCFCIERR